MSLFLQSLVLQPALWLLLLLACSQCLLKANALSREDLFPFGDNAGDESLQKNDDDNSLELCSDVPYTFFTRKRHCFFVNNNGIITFSTFLRRYSVRPFPLEEDFQTISVFYSDVDTRESGQLFFRITSNPEIRERADKIICEAFSNEGNFQSRSVTIATWDSVGSYPEGTDLLNTFQCVMASDGEQLYSIHLYQDIQWIRVNTTNSIAQVGFNAGDGVSSYTLPTSHTEAVRNVTQTSNAGMNGLWVFRVSGPSVEVSGCLDRAVGSTYPNAFSFNFDNALTENGSSRTGDCSDVQQTETLFTCSCASSSVLLDGVIPALNFSDNMWASQLFILRRFASSVSSLSFEWSDNMFLSSIEVVLFNCPEWKIAAEAITIFDLEDAGSVVSSASLNVSCEDLVTVVIPVGSSKRLSRLKLEFAFFQDANAISMAEVRFFTKTCGNQSSITTQLLPTSVTTEDPAEPPLEVFIIPPLLGCIVLVLLVAVPLTVAAITVKRSRKSNYEERIYDEIADDCNHCSTWESETSFNVLTVEDDQVHTKASLIVQSYCASDVATDVSPSDCSRHKYVKIFDILRTNVYDEVRDIEPNTSKPYICCQ